MQNDFTWNPYEVELHDTTQIKKTKPLPIPEETDKIEQLHYI